MLLSICAPANNERDPQYMQAVLTDLLKANRSRLPFTLGFASIDGRSHLVADVPRGLLTLFERYLSAKYPDVGSKRNSGGDTKPRTNVWHQSLWLSPDIQPLRLAEEFQDHQVRNFADPVATLLEAVSSKNGVNGRIIFHVSMASSYRRWVAKRLLQRLSHPFWDTRTTLADHYASWANGTWRGRLCVAPLALLLRRQTIDRAYVPSEQKLRQALVHVAITVEAWSEQVSDEQIRKRLALLCGSLEQFTEPGRVAMSMSKPKRGVASPKRTSLLSVPELASLWHIPTDTVQTPSLARPAYRQLPPPVTMDTSHNRDGDALVGKVDFQDDRRPVRIAESDRLHTLIIGKSGVGKSTLMHNMVGNDCQTGRGVAVVDPHGDLVADVLQTIPRYRTNDVVLLDIGDRHNTVTFNPLACDSSFRQPAVAESLLTTLMRVFGFDAASAPRMMHILRNTLLSLVGQPEVTLLDVERMLTDKKFRKRMVGLISDDKIRSFWTHEVANWTPRYESEALPAILNKLGQFTAHPMVRAVLNHPKGTLNVRKAMDEQKIVLVNLSQGAVGGAAAALLGSLLVAEIQQAALSRSDTEKDQRTPFYLYVDEYPVYVNDSFAVILAEARKYGLFLTAAQQLTQQCSETLMANMFGNVSTIACFQVAFDDAQIFADQLGEPLAAVDLIHLPKYRCVVRATINGVPTRPFTVATLPPMKPNKRFANADTVRRVSQKRHGDRRQSSVK